MSNGPSSGCFVGTKKGQQYSVAGIIRDFNSFSIGSVSLVSKILQSKRFMRAPNLEISCATFECRMRRFGNSLQRFAPNVPTSRQNVRANLTNFNQDLFWRVRFSNKDFKIVEDSLASLAIVKV